MDLREAIRTTGAVREFTDEPVDAAAVTSILDDARFAPSGGNRQPWRVAVVEDRELRRRLAELMRPTWDEYLAASHEGQVPFNAVDYRPPDPTAVRPRRSSLLDRIETIPVVLAIAADLRRIVAIDQDLDRVAVVPGASIYPFCWSLLLSARAHDLGGVMTTLLTHTEPEAGGLLGLPEDHALAAVIFLGHPVQQPTRLARADPTTFATTDTFDGPPY